MSSFRRFVIGLSEFLLVLLIIGGTIGGAIFGYLTAQTLMFALPYRTPSFYVAGVADRDLLGIVVGGLVGFLLPALSASLLFLLSEIQKNTQAAAECLMRLRGGT